MYVAPEIITMTVHNTLGGSSDEKGDERRDTDEERRPPIGGHEFSDPGTLYSTDEPPAHRSGMPPGRERPQVLHLSRKANEALQVIERIGREHNDRDLLTFLERATDLLLRLQDPVSEPMGINACVREIEQMFIVGKGTTDIALDYRQEERLTAVQRILTAILEERWPLEEKPEGVWQKGVTSVLHQCRRLFNYTLGRRAASIATGRIELWTDMERNSDREKLEKIVDQITNARFGGRRAFLAGAGSTILALSGYKALRWLMSGDEGKTSETPSPDGKGDEMPSPPENDPSKEREKAPPLESPEDQILKGFSAVSAGGRRIRVTVSIPPNSGHTLNETVKFYIGAPGEFTSSVNVINSTAQVPDNIATEGGTVSCCIKIAGKQSDWTNVQIEPK